MQCRGRGGPCPWSVNTIPRPARSNSGTCLNNVLNPIPRLDHGANETAVILRIFDPFTEQLAELGLGKIFTIVSHTEMGQGFVETADGIAQKLHKFPLGAAAEAFGHVRHHRLRAESLICTTNRRSARNDSRRVNGKIRFASCRARCQKWSSVKLRAAGMAVFSAGWGNDKYAVRSTEWANERN